MVKVVFSAKELEGETGRNSEPTEMVVVNGFCLKEINPLFVKSIEEILKRLPPELQEVFPLNVRKKLKKMGLEEDYNIEANLEINTIIYWKSKNGVETDDRTVEGLKEIVWTKWRNCRVPVDVDNENAGSLWIINQENVESHSLLEILKKWSGDNKSVNIYLDKGEKAKFLVIHNLDKKLEEMEKYLIISAVFINVQIVKEKVGDMVCSFCILLSPEGEIKKIIRGTYGAEYGQWEIMIEDEIKGYLSLEEAIKYLEEAATERECRSKSTRVMESFKFLFG